MPYIVATCTKDYADTNNPLEVTNHRDENISVPIEDENTAIQFAIEAVQMVCALYEMAGEQVMVIPNGPLLNVCTATRVVSFGIKTF